MPATEAARPPALAGTGPIKLLSLLLATIVWFAIREAISFETVISDVPVHIRHDEGWAVLERSDETVDIRFRGSRADLAELTRERIKVTVNVRGDQTNRARIVVKITPDNIKAPGGARPVHIEPEQITFSMDREGERMIPVKAEIQDKLPDGFEIEQIVCTPATVLLRGPLSKLQDVDAVHTMPIELEGRVQSFKTRRSLVAPPAVVTARLDPDRVQVELTVVEHSATRRFEGLPVGVLRPPGPATSSDVRPERVDVEFQGRDAVLKNLTLESIHAYVDATQLGAGSRYELPVQIFAPSGLRVLSVKPDVVSVQLGP